VSVGDGVEARSQRRIAVALDPILDRLDGADFRARARGRPVGQMKDILGKAANAANSWGNAAARDEASKRKDSLAASNGARNVEQWAVNKALHYNEWANFGRKDFEPVVAAFKELVSQFRCEGCQSWLYVTPRAPAPEVLRCSCMSVNINLKAKSK
jgi:hypothetical protein